MDIKELLEQVKRGECAIEDAVRHIEKLPYEELDFAKLDHHRTLRGRFGETVFCQGKTPEECAIIFTRFAAMGENILGTRATQAHCDAVQAALPDVVWYARAGVLAHTSRPTEPIGRVAVCTAGTSDIPVAEEAALTAAFFGAKVERIFDVGVAGIHRLFARMDDIHEANCVIACAGMEGALASVVGGLVRVPVVALPTSIGYGASFGGLSALLTMLNSCAEGVATVNIDNGFGAGYLAAQINRLAVTGR